MVRAPGDLAQWQWLHTVYQVQKGQSWDIYSYHDLIEHQLTDSAADDTQPRFAHDALKIVFVSNRDGNDEIYRMNADGTQQRRLTQQPARDSAPDWSADGSKIVYVSEQNGNPDLYIMRADGSGQFPLLMGPEADLEPTWSPDGGQIAWVRRNSNGDTLWLMNADGSDAHPISAAQTSLARPRWSPDSTTIAFDFTSAANPFRRLAVVHRDGSGFYQLPCNFPEFEDNWMSTWLPDGESILFTRLLYAQDSNPLTLVESFFQWVAVTPGFCTTGVNSPSFPFSALPHMVNSDPWPPASHVVELPAYSRLPALVVSFRGTDVGPSGIMGYDLQIRTAANQAWLDEGDRTIGEKILLSGLPPGTVFLRSRAEDSAGNVEAWPGDAADTSTTLYAWQLAGTLYDGRRVPLARQTIAVAPAPITPAMSDKAGQYVARLAQSGSYQLAGRLAISVTTGSARDLYVLPAKNSIQNGNFEAADPLAGWHSGGDLPPRPTDGAYEGDTMVALGDGCTALCPIAVPEDLDCRPGLDAGCQTDLFQLVADPQGNLHLFGEASQGNAYYQHWPIGGELSGAEMLTGTLMSTLSAASDAEGDLALAWSQRIANTSSTWMVSTRKRPAGGAWSTALPVGPGYRPELASDGQGQLHMVYFEREPIGPTTTRLLYRVQNASGHWSATEEIADLPSDVLDFSLAAQADGAVYVFWVERPTGMVGIVHLAYRVRSVTGVWSQKQVAAEATVIYNPQVRIDVRNNVHV
ncbi:MAG TPA: hypothetical protein PKE45_14805, partial [Caldilineaceae bacterium]|nr:hypothetical protein [Caldilineaceae bacterium]